MILNLLPPQPSPACAFESVVVAGISKAAFEQVLAALAITAGTLALAAGSGLLELFLPVKTLNPSTTFGFGALVAQRTLIADACSGHILIGPFVSTLLPAPHLLTCRASVGVSHSVINESVLSKEFASARSSSLRRREICHMRLNPPVHTF